MSKKKSGSQKIKDPEEAKALAVEWFLRENKPVTSQSLTDALGSRVAKALVQKTLDTLLVEGTLQAKDLKKTRFFYLNLSPNKDAAGGEVNPSEDVAGLENNGGNAQSDKGTEGTPPPEEKDEDEDAHVPALLQDDAGAEQEGTLQKEEEELPDVRSKEALIAELISLNHSIQEADQRLAASMGLPTSAERRDRLATLQGEVAALASEVAEAESNAAAVAAKAQQGSGTNGALSLADALDDAVYRYHRARTLWKERKELVDRLVEGVIGDSCSKAELVELFGITTDVEAGVSFTTSAVLLPKSLTPTTRNHL